MRPRDGSGQAEGPASPEGTLMTARWIPTLVVLICCFLTVATSAFAECAWVFWEAARPRPTWSIKGAYTSMPACAADREAHIRAVLKATPMEAFKGIKRAGDTIFFDPKHGEPYSAEYFCFPDTVNPRGTR